MSYDKIQAYDIDPHVAEIYDQFETQTDDIELVRRLVGGPKPLRILEPFCGTGRILIPLAEDGHEMVGTDQAKAMLDRAEAKIAQLDLEVRRRITLIQADATGSRWPTGFDLVILGGNCFYELDTPDEQEGCIASAAAALKPGGHVYLDNDHMEGDLEEPWRVPGVRITRFPSGTCEDGTRLEGTTETIWYDAPRRLWRGRRSVTIVFPDGSQVHREWLIRKHPVSAVEQQNWLAAHGFVVEQVLGDRSGSPYTGSSDRAIFWARKM
jgi:SAM-dependent methyltransferase